MKTKMEVRKKRDAVISKIKNVTVIIATLLTVFSCRSTDVEGNLNPAGQVAVNVNIEDDIFEGISNIGNKASAKKSESKELPVIQKSTVAFSKDFYMVAELTEEVPVIAQKGAKASVQQGNKSATQTNDLNPNIKYKTVVYKNTGEYVTEKDYARGQETSAGPLLLNSGSYTFVVYSINSTSVLPAVAFADPANKTLSNSSVAVTGSQDLMYFRKDMSISASNTNYLGVVLKHKFSQITTTVDATATGYNITAITSAINPQHRPYASLALSDGTLTRSGTATSVAVTFPTLDAQTVTAIPTLINADASSTSYYSISSITIGVLTQTNITPFSDLVITPGVKYNMKVKIVPSDAYIIHQGIPAVRINGQIWMRHNVGVNTAVDPDVATSLIHGNYYQWGRKISIGNGTSMTVTNWNGNNNPPVNAWNSKANLWNSGTEAPVKTANDPCPAGFRVPTYIEFSELMNDLNVISNDIGTSFASPSNYSYAKVLTSTRNSNIKITLPGQGWYNTNSTPPYTATAIQSRGEFGYYWTSQRFADGVFRFKFSKNQKLEYYANSTGSGSVDLLKGLVIRCIAQ